MDYVYLLQTGKMNNWKESSDFRDKKTLSKCTQKKQDLNVEHDSANFHSPLATSHGAAVAVVALQ